jgi:hypothetical protein
MAMKNQISVRSWGRKHWVFASGTFVLLACLIATAHEALRPSSPARQAQTVPITRAATLASYGKLPLVFEKNLGQTSPQVKFLAHASGYALFLTGHEAVLRLDVPEPETTANSAAAAIKHRAGRDAKDRKVAVVSLSLAGSHSPAQIEGLDVQPGHTNYFIGRNSSRWQRNVPLYARVKYSAVYPGVDAIYYGNESRLETDYIVGPGSDPNQIVLHVRGSKSLATDAQGNVVLASAAGNLILHRPNVYQQIGGTRQAIAANYFELGKNSIGIRLGAYDSRQRLVIDPVLDYSTLLGGSGGESGNAIAVDSSGDAYVCGKTSSSLFPTTNGVIQGSLKVSTATNAFITEFDPTGTTLIFSTYLGGSIKDSCTGIGLDSSENVYVTGTTSSLDFPLGANPNPIMASFPSGNLGTTGFFAEVSSAGTALTYSTYLGGNYRDTPAGLAMDPTGIPYVVGTTESTNFPISPLNAYQTTSIANDNSNGGAGFLSKINPSLPGQTALLYSTYLGGSIGDSALAVAVDAAENAYITGGAESSDFPTLNAYQPFINGGQNAFVTRIDTTQSGISSLIYSSYLGGSGNNGGEAYAIAADNNFNAYIGGITATNNFPTTAGVITPSQAAAGYIMGFVARFDTSKSGNSSLLYSTYLGGSNVSGTLIYGIAADTLGDAYVTGSTFTNNYYNTFGAPQGQLAGISNAIVTELNPTGSGALFSTYFGGSNNDQANAIVLDSSAPPNVYIAGTANSENFPVTLNAFQKNLDGLTDAFVVKMSPVAAQGVYASPATLSFGNQGTGTSSSSQTVTLTNNASSTLSNIAITFTGSNPLDFSQSNTCGETNTVAGSLPEFSQCTISVIFTPSNSGAESATMDIEDSGAGSPQTVALTGNGTAIAVSPSSLAFGNQIENTASAAQSVTITNNGANSLTGIAISVTGFNAADFTQTNTCGSTSTTTGTLTAGANCMINVTFTPTTAAAESASLQIIDSDPSSPQVVQLTGTGTLPVSGVSLSPTSLSFGNQSENTSSLSQPVTLTNNGTGSLTTITISFTGTNASDFSQTNTCGSPSGTLAAGASCTINVTFTPTTQAAESANLSVADSNVTSPQLVPITGTGTVPVTAFTVSISPSSETINAGDTTTVVATVTSENAFNSPVSFAFAGTPGDASFTASPSPVTPPANGSITSTITIVTDLKSVAPHSPFSFPFGSQRPLWVWSLSGLLLAMFAAWAARGRAARRLACTLAMLLLIGLVSCTGTPSTPTGTYTVKISGVSGSQNFPATFTLTVK